jgi:GTPase SAR1 family protein
MVESFEESKEASFKVVIAGDPNVGKTTLLKAFLHDDPELH